MAGTLARRIANSVVDTVFPPRCAGCGHRGVWVCDECLPDLRRLVPPLCDRCGEPVGPSLCRCDDIDTRIIRVRSAAEYDGWLRSAIVELKYEGVRARAPHLAGLLLPVAGEMRPEALIPVPLHATRLAKRGYNQAELMARHLGASAGIPVIDALVRVRSTEQQVNLDAHRRRQNVAGAFSLRPGAPIAGKHVALIDDVMTTGSTISACAAALTESGAASVSVLTLARER